AGGARGLVRRRDGAADHYSARDATQRQAGTRAPAFGLALGPDQHQMLFRILDRLLLRPAGSPEPAEPDAAACRRATDTLAGVGDRRNLPLRTQGRRLFADGFEDGAGLGLGAPVQTGSGRD